MTQLTYYEKNKERILKYQKEYYYKNIQRYKLYNHIYYMSIRKPKIQAYRQPTPTPTPPPEPKQKRAQHKPQKLTKERQFLNNSLILTFD